jgi:hypothetical protein
LNVHFNTSFAKKNYVCLKKDFATFTKISSIQVSSHPELYFSFFSNDSLDFLKFYYV